MLSSDDSSLYCNVLPEQDNSYLQDQEKQRRNLDPDTPLRFAKKLASNVDLISSMEWQETDQGQRIGKYRLKSAGAYTLNLNFSNVVLSPSCQINIYNPKNGYAIQPLLPKDILANKEIWTPVILGEDCIVELITTDEISNLSLVLESVFHDFVGFAQESMRVSGSCNLDVICGESDGFPQVEVFRKVISSVGAYHFNGKEICTGAAINNTSRDCKPYFLTAHHCGVNSLTAPSMVVYWNYENSYCRQPLTSESGQAGDGSLSQYTLGATVLASWATSDFTLVELNHSIDPDFQVYLSGWDRSSSLPSKATTIHHPNLDEKRISIDFQSPQEWNDNFLRIQNWEIGSTEDGSSGAPLYNDQQQIIGQLFGGQAECGNNEWDAFGWFHRSWSGGGTPQTRLSDWLDPEETNETNIAGHNCSYEINYSLNEVNACTEVVNSLEVELIANEAFNVPFPIQIGSTGGLDVSLSSDIIVFEMNPILHIDNISEKPEGKYTVSVIVEANGINLMEAIDIILTERPPQAPILTYPQNGSEKLGINQSLYWEGSADTYEVILAADSDFETIVFEHSAVSSNAIELPQLHSNGNYYWKVRGSNICGEGEWSDVYSFNTGFNFCTTLVNSMDVTIPENSPSTHFYAIDCPYDVNAQSVLVGNIRGRHSYVSDLYFWVTKGLQQIFLWGGGCGSTADFSIGFSIDEQNTPSCPITDGLLYKPAQTYQAILGSSALGSWDIRIEDKEAGDGGFIDQASLTICFDEVYQDLIVPSTNKLFLCDEVIEFDVFTSIESAEFITYRVLTSSGQEIPFEILGELPCSNQKSYTLRIDRSDLEFLSGNIKALASFGETTLTTVLSIEEGDDTPNNPIISNLDGLVIETEDQILVELLNEPTSKTVLEVASDSDFLSIVHSQTFTDITAAYIQLDWVPGQDYFIRTINYSPFKTCGAISTSQSFKCNTVSSVDEVSETCILEVYPNPTTDNVEIIVENLFMTDIEVYSITGKCLSSNILNTPTQKYTLRLKEQFTRGMYLVKVRLSDNTYQIAKVSLQ